MSQGVCSHSTEVSQESWLLLSTNYPISFKHLLQMYKMPFKDVVGYWKSIQERSFLIRTSDMPELMRLLPHLLNGQEAVLHLGPSNARGKRPAHLIHLSNLTEEYIGLFQETVFKPAHGTDYTFDPMQNRYFICVIEDKKAIRDWDIPSELHEALLGIPEAA